MVESVWRRRNTRVLQIVNGEICRGLADAVVLFFFLLIYLFFCHSTPLRKKKRREGCAGVLADVFECFYPLEVRQKSGVKLCT